MAEDSAIDSAVKIQAVSGQQEVPAAAQPVAVAAAKPVARRRTAKAATEQPVSAGQVLSTGKAMLFGKYSYDVDVLDLSLKNQINLKPDIYPLSYGRASKRSFAKAGMNIIERMENALMRGAQARR